MRTRVFMGILFFLLQLPAGGLPVTAQEGGVDFVVEPAPGSETAEEGGYFLIGAEQGTSVSQTLALRNDSSERLRLQLAVSDATTGPYGGVSYGVPDDPVERTGRWITLERRSVILAPGDSAHVGFEVEVPLEAESGDHLAGISVWSPAATGGTQETQEEQTAAVQVQTRRVIAVQVNLPGASQPELTISGVDAAARPDGLYLEIGIENIGHGLTQGSGEVVLPSEGFQQTFALDTFVPRTQIGYPVRWTDAVPEGEYEARVEIDYEGGTAFWEGTFTVGREVLEDLADRGVHVSNSRPAWLWPAVGAALVVVASAVLIMMRRRPVRPAVVRSPSAATPTSSAGRRIPPPPPPPPPAPPPASHQ